jgi:hypothetical protein
MSKKIADEDLEWLVKNRSNCQDFLMDLHRTVQADEKISLEQAVPGALLGIGFSLWRAVFLVVTSVQGEMDAAGKKFLSTLIADNMIAYQQDQNSSAWTAGYYVNSALLRLDLIYRQRLGGSPTKLSRFVHGELIGQTYLDIAAYKEELKRQWLIAMGGAKEILTMLKDGKVPGASL